MQPCGELLPPAGPAADAALGAAKMGLFDISNSFLISVTVKDKLTDLLGS
jgi:hypothetical protein